jgi:Kdo2-lipid IVA lauroyltransferase/acyltransferase
MFDRLLSRLAAWLVSWLRRGDPDRASDRWGAFARRIGPFLPANRIGRDNLRAAFPEKDPAWIEATLGETWENLGRVIGEYVHLGRIWDYDPDHPDAGRIETDAAPLLVAVRDDGLPALCFAAHLGNWELPAVAVHQHGVPSAVVYRMPNNRAIAGEIVKIRGGLMGRLIRTRAEAAFEMAGALDAGLHLGMLVDQHFSRGVDVTFFGRTCKANPTIARLARQYDCPVVGVRVIRLPGHRFRISAIGPITLPRAASMFSQRPR